MEAFSLVKFFTGFNILDGAKLGKILFFGVLILIALTIYHKAFEPKSVTRVEKIETQIVNNCPQENKILGATINLWKFRLSAGL